MSKRHYDDWLRTFVDFASFGEAPLKMLFWTGVSTMAGALRRRVWIDQKYFQWIPNFYVIFVAPPGIVSKSTTANIGMNLLRGVDGVKMGPDIVTWQSIITSLGKNAESFPVPNAPGEFYPMSAVTFCSDELGNLLKLKDGDLIDALVSLWDGKQGSFSKQTKTSGDDFFENPFINIIGCTTPSWISGNVPDYMIGGGFTSRCVFVYADEKRQLVPYVDEAVPEDFKDIGKRLIEDLTYISQFFGEVSLSNPARQWGRDWYRAHWKKKPSHVGNEQYHGYLARKQTHIHKLAIIITASSDDSLLVTRNHLEQAQAMITALEGDMPKIFAKVGQNSASRGSAEICAIVEKAPGITQVDLFRRLFRTMSFREFEVAIQSAIAAQRITSLGKGNDIHYYPRGENAPESNQASTA